MKNEENQPAEELKKTKIQSQDAALSKDQNEKENREEIEKVNNGLEIDEIDRPEE